MAENPFSRDRWVRLEVDYEAYGVWNRDGIACSPDYLPVAAATVARIRAWQQTFDEATRGFEGVESDELDQKLLAHWIDGFDIANEVKAQLLDWTVVVGGTPFEHEVVPRARRRSKPSD